ncbi:signal peptidase II [Alkalibacter saccharofermentans]|uniref:Lipoprotein signal peptidase n=1 Tax=Alkalibacter saccharofermentans DSM 14828 TaxID=1120975 RepID=A0A1M4ZN41_9FIRM|nr:signal peptidase II [Alkalibacter saccharofermentans]SHF19217.1 signal peptidase II [Alkalibacter saccharofermentans DSM 14828]
MDKLLLCLMLIFTGVLIDLFTKRVANEKLIMNYPVKITKRIYFVLLHNKGAAYGLLKGRKSLLRMLSTLSIMFLLGIFFFALKAGYSYDFMISLSLVISGALGNYLERMTSGYVTDFLYIKFKKFPVFNLADIYIVAGTILVFINA